MTREPHDISLYDGRAPGLSRSGRCCSDWLLDRHLAGELPGEEARALDRHLEGSPPCRQRLDEIVAVRAAFLADGGLPLLPPRRSRWRVGLGAAGALAAGALAVVVVLSVPPRGVRSKGGPALEVVARTPGGRVFEVSPGGTLSPDDVVRFRFGSPRPGHLAILGIDAAGFVSVYHPDGPLAPAWPAGRARLVPGSVVLDETLGAERLVAFSCRGPVSTERLVAAARRTLERAHGDPARLGEIGVADCQEAAFLIRKVARR